jgi:hypothetical protein
MPLKPGKSDKVVSENISEFHGGATYQHTKEKFGKETADKQAVAAAMNKAGRGRKRTLSDGKIKHKSFQ